MLKEISDLVHGKTGRILNLINQVVVIWQLLMLAFMYFVNLTLYLVFARKDLKRKFVMLQTDVSGGSDTADEEQDLLTQDEIQDIGVTTSQDPLDLAIGYTFYRANPSKQWKVYRSKRRFHFVHVSLYLSSLLFLGLISGGCALYLAMRKQDIIINTFAQSLGYISSVVIFVQWIPQIVHTFLSKSPGNFSIFMMMLLCPGAFVNVVYLAATGQSISTWFSYFVSGLQQIVLLALLIYYSIKERIAKRKQQKLDAYKKMASSPMTISEENLRFSGSSGRYGYGAVI